MALLSTIICRVCQKKKDVSHSASDSPPDVCYQCEDKINADARTKYLLNLSRLTVDERLTRIEAALYDASKRPEPSHWDGRIG